MDNFQINIHPTILNLLIKQDNNYFCPCCHSKLTFQSEINDAMENMSKFGYKARNHAGIHFLYCADDCPIKLRIDGTFTVISLLSGDLYFKPIIKDQNIEVHISYRFNSVDAPFQFGIYRRLGKEFKSLFESTNRQLLKQLKFDPIALESKIKFLLTYQ